MAGQPGRSGRKPSARTQFKREIEAAKKLFAHNLQPISQALVDAARGCYVLLIQTEIGWQRVGDEKAAIEAIEGGAAVRVYVQDPDVRAGLEILERVMGKVPQEINHEVRHVIEQAVEDQAAIVRILEEHLPPEHLAPILGELRRIREHHRAATRLVTG